jgi:hypothetical protein
MQAGNVSSPGGDDTKLRRDAFMESPLLTDSSLFKGTSSMRTFGLKVLMVVVAALVGTAVIHSLVYLSIDPGILSAQMPR